MWRAHWPSVSSDDNNNNDIEDGDVVNTWAARAWIDKDD